MKILVKNEVGRTIKEYNSFAEAGRLEGISRETIRRSCLGFKIRGRYHYELSDKPSESRYSFRSRTVLITNDGLVKVYNKQSDLAKAFNYSPGTISNFVTGRQKCPFGTLMNYDDYVKLYGEPKEDEQKIIVIKNNYSRRIVELDLDGNYVKTYRNQADVGREKGLSYQTINHYLRGVSSSKYYKLMYEDEYEELYGKIEEVKEEPKEPTKTTKEDYYINVLVGLVNGTLQEGATYEISGNKFTYDKEKQSLMFNNEVGYSRERLIDKVKIELPLLNDKERNFLKNLLLAFSNVKGIRKCKDRINGFEFIRIETNNEEDNITLPSFVEGKYYGALQHDRLYTVEELNI